MRNALGSLLRCLADRYLGLPVSSSPIAQAQSYASTIRQFIRATVQRIALALRQTFSAEFPRRSDLMPFRSPSDLLQDARLGIRSRPVR